MDPVVAAKKRAGERACDDLKSGMIVGLGTGSTAEWAVRRVGELVKGGMDLKGVPTSIVTEKLARECGVPLLDLNDVTRIDVTIDGADEVDPSLDLIKGLGGALLREKIVASITARQIIVVDDSKLVKRLGEKAPVPVEVLPFGHAVVKRKLEALGFQATLRAKNGQTVVTDNGNYVYDIRHPSGALPPAAELERTLNNIPGVVENGFFLGITKRVVIADRSGETRILDK
ncbi:MAG TPA: ribose-5-phosphate isomerase RpiA [Candidatus Thermoplasmatota archaeon]|nr:ribose-5-phosphate isomerase RpiA [Candidatus Thermoplasmatota archaeon]